MSATSKVFRCVVCNNRFSEKDFEELRFYPSTGVCHFCYKDAQKDSETCFGKKKFWSEKAVVCQKICPDRRICRLFIRLVDRTGDSSKL